jgi:hypothetical protein
MLQNEGFDKAAGPGFEPGLSDSELISVGSPLFAGVSKTAGISRIFRFHVSQRLPMFTLVTVSVTVEPLQSASH